MTERPDDLSARLHASIGDIVTDMEIELISVDVKGPRNKRVVKLIADSMDTDDGLDIDRIATLSSAVGDIADEIVPGSYTLEVSSPGVDRPLTTPRHFRRNLDRLVEVRHVNGDTDTQTTGTIADVTDESVMLDTAKGPVTIPHDEVFEGRIVLPW